MNIKATDFCDVSNSAEGVIKAINELQSGDTLIFPKNEYHFYKERCIHKVCHMTNTDSFFIFFEITSFFGKKCIY